MQDMQQQLAAQNSSNSVGTNVSTNTIQSTSANSDKAKIEVGRDESIVMNVHLGQRPLPNIPEHKTC